MNINKRNNNPFNWLDNHIFGTLVYHIEDIRKEWVKNMKNYFT